MNIIFLNMVLLLLVLLARVISIPINRMSKKMMFHLGAVSVVVPPIGPHPIMKTCSPLVQIMKWSNLKGMMSLDDVSLDDAYQEALSGKSDKLVRYNKQIDNAFKRNKPTMDQWVLSWPKENVPEENVPIWLNVYGYYDKDKGCGGYGVILRNAYVKPIIAAARFTQGKHEERSQLVQALKGVETGLNLAFKHGYCRRLTVLCNVEKAVYVLNQLIFGRCACIVRAENHEVIRGVCKNCTKQPEFVDDDSTLDTLVGLMGQIKSAKSKLIHGFDFVHITRDENEAAHRLAKDAKKKKKMNGCEVPEEIKPVQFPKKLKNILFHDAYGLDTSYSRALVRGRRV